ncbi:hypothetical protein LTS17_005607 [Exophiala oligosperma]
MRRRQYMRSPPPVPSHKIPSPPASLQRPGNPRYLPDARPEASQRPEIAAPLSLPPTGSTSQPMISDQSNDRLANEIDPQFAAEVVDNIDFGAALGALSAAEPAPTYMSNEFESLRGQPQALSALSTTTSSKPTSDCVCDIACKSPFPWVAIWCRRNLDTATIATLQATQSLTAPSFETVLVLFEHYFVHLNTSKPCVSEWDLYRCIFERSSDEQGQQWKISLSLLNAVLFAASGFVSKEVAEAAGFSSIMLMRRTFYTRAKTLYDAGCEQNNMDRLRICLLLSHFQSFPVANHEPGSWLLEARRILLQADLQYQFTNNSRGKLEKRWRLLYCCFIMELCSHIISSRLRGPTIDVPDDVPKMQIEDLEDATCTWFMDPETKKKAMEMFLGYVNVSKILLPLRRLLQCRNAEVLSTLGRDPNTIERSQMTSDLESVESQLTEWHDAREKLFEKIKWPATFVPGEVSNWVMQASVELSYWYILSLVHQLDLSSNRPRTTKWAAVMQVTSCTVLQQASTNITRILRGLLQQDYVRYLQDTIIPYVLVPLIISTVYLRSTASTSACIVHDLSTCYRVLAIFAERYEVVDYYLQLVEMCAAIAYDRLLLEKVPYPAPSNGSSLRKLMSTETDDTPLPPIKTYLAALTALENCLVRGITDPVKCRHAT